MKTKMKLVLAALLGLVISTASIDAGYVLKCLTDGDTTGWGQNPWSNGAGETLELFTSTYAHDSEVYVQSGWTGDGCSVFAK